MVSSVLPANTTVTGYWVIVWRHSFLKFLHIETGIKWPPFRRRHFQMHFLKRKCMNFDWNSIEICPHGSSWQHFSIGSDNGLAPARRQAIIWTLMVSLLTHVGVTRPQRVKCIEEVVLYIELFNMLIIQCPDQVQEWRLVLIPVRFLQPWRVAPARR